MYVSEILERCSEMAARTAQVYRRLADRLRGQDERVQLWRELALGEEIHADILRRELQSFQEQDVAGSFLPEYAERLRRLDADLHQLEERAEAAHTLDEALAVAVALEQADLEDLYDDLVLQGEPAFKLISERLEAALAVRPERVPAAGLARRQRRTAVTLPRHPGIRFMPSFIDARREAARAFFEFLERQLSADEVLSDKHCVQLIVDKARAEHAAKSRKRFDPEDLFRRRLLFSRIDDVIAAWCRKREVRTEPFNVFRYEGPERGRHNTKPRSARRWSTSIAPGSGLRSAYRRSRTAAPRC